MKVREHWLVEIIIAIVIQLFWFFLSRPFIRVLDTIQCIIQQCFQALTRFCSRFTTTLH